MTPLQQYKMAKLYKGKWTSWGFVVTCSKQMEQYEVNNYVVLFSNIFAIINWYVCTYCMYVCLCMFVCVYVYVYVCVCMFSCMCVCMYVCFYAGQVCKWYIILAND